MYGKNHLARVAALALFVMIGTGAWAEGTPRELRTPPDAGQLRGAWRVLQIPEEGGPPPFLMLMLFTRDGGVVQTDAGPPNPLQFSPGLGEWTRTSDGHYEVSYAQMEFDAGQNHTGNFRALLNVTIDETTNELRGTVVVRFYDVNDVLLFEGNGTVLGTRFAKE